MKKKTDIYRTDWNGHLLEIQYEPLWMPAHVTGEDLAHIQVRSIYPTDAPLPIAKTGFYTNTLPASTIRAASGPVAFIDVMLAAEALHPSLPQFTTTDNPRPAPIAAPEPILCAVFRPAAPSILFCVGLLCHAGPWPAALRLPSATAAPVKTCHARRFFSSARSFSVRQVPVTSVVLH
jgi:hypothetical protein